MKNPISYLYEKVDNTIMYGVNKGVKAWNWTTGQTKADLANQLLTVAPVAEISSYFLNRDLFYEILGSPVMIFLSHVCQIKNKKQEAEEEKAAENRTKLYAPHFEMGNRKRQILKKQLTLWSGKISRN